MEPAIEALLLTARAPVSTFPEYMVEVRLLLLPTLPVVYMEFAPMLTGALSVAPLAEREPERVADVPLRAPPEMLPEPALMLLFCVSME